MPGWIWGGDPEAFFEHACLRFKRLSGDPPEWRVQTDETYLRQRRPGLVDVHHIAGPGTSRSNWQRLVDLPEGVAPPQLAPFVTEAIARLRQTAQESSSIVDLISSMRVELMTVSLDQLGEQARIVFEAMRDISFSDGQGDPPFSDASVHLIRRREELVHRMKLPQVMLRIESGLTAKELGNNHPSDHQALFAAANGLQSGTYLMDPYIRPLLGAISPSVWAFSSTRAKGPLIFGFGRAVSGARGDASELLQMLWQSNAKLERPKVAVSASMIDATISWWAGRLDRLLSVVSDLAIQCDREGLFSAARQLDVRLTVEQLFHRIASLQGALRDTETSRVLFFSVIDTLTWFTGKSFEKLCNLNDARKVLERLESALPSDVASLLLPNARRGVAALEELQAGFFIRRQRGTAMVELRGPGAFSSDVDPATAVSQYIGALRNAIHGYGAKRHIERTAALVSQHDGNIPDDLAYVGYLHFLNLLSSPDALALSLAAASRRAPLRA